MISENIMLSDIIDQSYLPVKRSESIAVAVALQVPLALSLIRLGMFECWH